MGNRKVTEVANHSPMLTISRLQISATLHLWQAGRGSDEVASFSERTLLGVDTDGFLPNNMVNEDNWSMSNARFSGGAGEARSTCCGTEALR
jgi:hypothetical protein